MTDKDSVLVIGSGAAGATCARRLVRAGHPVMLADNDRWGGTCLWRGCIPKKALYHAAKVARTAASAEQYGTMCTDLRFDWPSALAWKWHSAETYAGDQASTLAGHGIELLSGKARFISPDEVDVSGRAIAPGHIVLATGSHPLMPEVPGIELADDSDAALRYPELPESLLIVGGGYIGFELAAVFASFGSRVTLVTRGARVLHDFAPELADVVVRRLGRMGVRFMNETTLGSIEGVRGGLSATLTGRGASQVLGVSRVLVATGRMPNLAALDLEAGAIELDNRGRLVVDAYLRTTNPKVWACGDVLGGMMQTPVANMEGATVAKSITTGTPMAPDCSAVPVTCFTVPQIASAGLTESEARERGIDVRVNRFSFDELGAAIIEDERDGLVQLVIAEKDGRILGGQMAGPTACDCIAALATALSANMTAEQFGAVIGVHPSFGEAWSYVAY